MMITANEALQRLQEGNKRFVSGVRSIDSLVKQMQRQDFVNRHPIQYLASTNSLRHGSQMLEQLILEDRLAIVAAEYSLETGVVEFITDI